MTESQMIVTALKTHATVKNVVPFGSSPLPAPPYTVVKLEPTELGYTRVRVSSHWPVNQTIAMEEYCRKGAFDLLAYQALTNSGRRIVLKPLGIGPVVTANSDSTISQEAIFRFAEIPY